MWRAGEDPTAHAPCRICTARPDIWRLRGTAVTTGAFVGEASMSTGTPDTTTGSAEGADIESARGGFVVGGVFLAFFFLETGVNIHLLRVRGLDVRGGEP